MRIPPLNYALSPEWSAFDLWADEHILGLAEEDWLPWWECFLAGYNIGLAEEGVAE